MTDKELKLIFDKWLVDNTDLVKSLTIDELYNTPELFDYYSEYWGDTFGVQPKLNAMVEKSGWFFEWFDPGTMMVWKNF